MSYPNLIMYSSVLPAYDDLKEEERFDESIDVNNPDNFNNEQDEIIVKK
ncbi:MAG: hypothetical protein LIP01_15650 [Tannerellaceae bacterium]|nr:hypothetical protein [Tannerellaceae bacterium]